jgi:hypothetical protein
MNRTTPPEALPRPSTILFLGLARDCEATLPIFFRYLGQLRDHGLSCSALVGENGSRDRTRLLLEQASGAQLQVVDTAFMAQGNSRLARMARGRQALLEAAAAMAPEPAYVCVLDLDNVMREPPGPEAVLKAIERLEADRCLFAVGATSSPVYYDLLALRAEGHDYATLNADLAAAKKRPFTYYQFHRDRIYRHQKAMTRAQPIPCLSSFNGFCLYRAADYWTGTYRGPGEEGLCEHVSLNLAIGRATCKRMLIAPELQVRTPADHAPVTWFRFWLDRLGKVMR